MLRVYNGMCRIVICSFVALKPTCLPSQWQYRLHCWGSPAVLPITSSQRARKVPRSMKIPHPTKSLHPRLFLPWKMPLSLVKSLYPMHPVVLSCLLPSRISQGLLPYFFASGGKPAAATRRLAKHLAEAVCCMHSAGMVHGGLSRSALYIYQGAF